MTLCLVRFTSLLIMGLAANLIGLTFSSRLAQHRYNVSQSRIINVIFPRTSWHFFSRIKIAFVIKRLDCICTHALVIYHFLLLFSEISWYFQSHRSPTYYEYTTPARDAQIDYFHWEVSCIENQQLGSRYVSVLDIISITQNTIVLTS